ncbi:hypothetical protein O4G98_06995 [Zoogloeaceae bacterium G21618-S1]|nr:hypothetical protein [Zoogloeaceae bacterium G21618-S1]
MSRSIRVLRHPYGRNWSGVTGDRRHDGQFEKTDVRIRSPDGAKRNPRAVVANRWIPEAALRAFSGLRSLRSLIGGFVASTRRHSDRVVAVSMTAGALLLLVCGWLAGRHATGFAVGIGGPSRDMMIKKAAPKGATGRVYGTVYSGLDVGFAISPDPVLGVHGCRLERRYAGRRGGGGAWGGAAYDLSALEVATTQDGCRIGLKLEVDVFCLSWRCVRAHGRSTGGGDSVEPAALPERRAGCGLSGRCAHGCSAGEAAQIRRPERHSVSSILRRRFGIGRV